MKSITDQMPRVRQTTFSAHARMGIHVIFAICVLGVLAWLVVSIRSERNRIEEKARQRVDAMVNVAVDDISHSLMGVQQTLRLLSRMPVMRKATFNGVLEPLSQKILLRGRRFLRHTAPILLQVWHGLRGFQNRFDQGVTVALAACRRGLYMLGMQRIGESGDVVHALAADAPIPSGSQATFSQSDLAWQLVSTLEAADNRFTKHFRTLTQSAAFLDRILGFGDPIIADPTEARRLLTASLDDRDLIRSLSIKTLQGEKIVSASEVNDPVGFFFRWRSPVRYGARPFYAGPVAFDEGLGRPLWLADVPLRDLTRTPFGALSSRVDLSFLSELSAKVRFSDSSLMYVVDENGIIIAHPKQAMVANQVDVSRANPAIAKVLQGKDGTQRISVFGAPYLLAYRQLKNVDHVYMPPWGVVFMAPLADFQPSMWAAVAARLLLAGLVLYALFFVTQFFLVLFEEDFEA